MPQVGRQPRDLTIERLVAAIADLPPIVSRESAVLIERKTLEATGVKLGEVDAPTRAQVSRLSFEIGLAEDRQKEFREKTPEAVRSLEWGVRKLGRSATTSSHTRYGRSLAIQSSWER